MKDVEKDSSRRNSHLPGSKKGGMATTAAVSVRRPFGVAAMDLTLYMSGKMEADEETDHFIPFIP